LTVIEEDINCNNREIKTMNSEWLSFLEATGAEINEGSVISFGNPEQERHVVSSGDIMCDLSHLSVLEVDGEDSADFLQNQFTNDINALDTGKSQLNGWCTPKGRMLAIFQVIRVAKERFLLLLPDELSDSIEKRLQMFVMRSKVTITNISDQQVRIGVSGPDAEQQLSSLIDHLPENIDDTAATENTRIVRLRPTLYPRFLIITDTTHAGKIWSHLDVKATPVSRGAWELLDIRAGVPSIKEQTQESFVPQMVNLQAINGLSFTKGCYPGQEVVARMEYLGKLKRMMYRITIIDESQPESGDRLYSTSSSSPQGAGEIVSVQKDGDGVWEGLAVVEVDIVEAKDLTLKEDGTILVTVQELLNNG